MSLTKDDLRAIRQITTEVTGTIVTEAIDKLALQVGEGFNEMGARLDRVEADVAVLKTDMREVKWHLTETVTRSEFHGLRERVEVLEGRR